MEKNKRLYIIWLAVVVSLGGFLFGYDTAVISGTLAFVRTQFGLAAAMEGWYVSSALVGCIAGVSVAGWLSDKYGRKRILLLAGILFSISAIGCALSGSFTTLVSIQDDWRNGCWDCLHVITSLYFGDFSPRIKGEAGSPIPVLYRSGDFMFISYKCPLTAQFTSKYIG